MKTSYLTIAEPVQAELKEKGSRFIAFTYPVQTTDKIKYYINSLREAHHKARHWCFAYRLGTDGNQFRANDDGEPAGSAGRPILGQIDSAGLTDTLIVVVRYFGGTLLGVPKLICAYKTVAAQSLKAARIIEKDIEKTVYLRCNYPYLDEAVRIGRQYQAKVIEQDLQLDCRLTVRIPIIHYELCITAWRQTRAIEVETEQSNNSNYSVR